MSHSSSVLTERALRQDSEARGRHQRHLYRSGVETLEPLLAHHSPLGLVTKEPSINAFVENLRKQLSVLQNADGKESRLSFSRREIEIVRTRFSEMLLTGERNLHRLCELLAHSLLQSQFKLSSTVFGRNPGTGERFVLFRDLTRDELHRRTDLDLGTAQLSAFRVSTRDTWTVPHLVANYVEYEALEANEAGVHRIVSRIKAEEEIWNKVVDELFGLDQLVRRDKQLRKLSPFIKDVFGVKVVVTDNTQARKLLEVLEELRWDAESLASVDLTESPSTSCLAFVEVKDYLGDSVGKASGWQAIKAVARWSELLFEIQIQPLRNHYLERSLIAAESHEEFKARREALREQVMARVPLYGFCRDLVRWLFEQPSSEPPTLENARVELGP